MIDVVRSISLIVLLMVISITVLISAIFLIIMIWKHYRLKVMTINNQAVYESLRRENRQRTVDYTEKTLEIVRMVIGQISVLKFRTFRDGKDITKVTLSNLRELARDVADTANEALNRDNIIFDDVIFTEVFFDEYIVETSFILIKEMFDRFLQDIE